MIRKVVLIISILLVASLGFTACNNGASETGYYTYYIDYENGTTPLGDLPIGTRVIDPSWEWEFRLGLDYSYYLEDKTTGPGEIKPVTWIVVAKNHYGGLEPHVTLLSEDLIGMHTFDNSHRAGRWIL